MKRLISIVVLLAVTNGCGPNNPLGRLTVNGKVTLDGEPLDHGMIAFSPQTPGGVGSGAVVKNGAYAIPIENGLPPGKYLVRINSAALATTPALGPTNGGPPGPGSAIAPGTERISPHYNTQSQILVEVVLGKTAQFDFETKSK